MTQKGYEVLKTFIEKIGRQHIDCVIGSKDPNVINDYYKEISNLCNSNEIIFYDMKDDYILNSNYSFAISWRWLINNLENPLIILHDSILPKYRGFAPLVTALIKGENKIGVSAFFASEDFDRGDIIDQKVIEVNYPIKITTAIKEMSNCYSDLVLEISRKIINGKKLKSYKQDESKASYSLWLDEEDYKIDWSKDAEFIKRFIDSVGYPYMGASSIVNRKKVRILDAEVEKEVTIENRTAGKVLSIKNGYPIVVCGKKLLKITNIIDDKTKDNILPLKKFRTRFK